MPETDSDDAVSAGIAKGVLDTVLSDQLGRGESLNQAAGVLAGLAGVVTAFAATSPAIKLGIGEVGLVGAAAAAVVAVVGLTCRRPGREPKHVAQLVTLIIGATPAVSRASLRVADIGAAERNDRRLRNKGAFVLLSAALLAVAVVLLVAATID